MPEQEVCSPVSRPGSKGGVECIGTANPVKRMYVHLYLFKFGAVGRCVRTGILNDNALDQAASSSNSAFASFRSRVSNPSVNQP